MALGPINFPSAPVRGQHYTAPNGQTYTFDGLAWEVGFYDSSSQRFDTIGDLINQIRTLLQDTDNLSGEYRYSTDSIVTNINQGMLELYRMRPDAFMANSWTVQQFSVTDQGAVIVIEQQLVPALVYYAVGLTQARDDEQNQDARAFGVLKMFQQIVISGAIA